MSAQNSSSGVRRRGGVGRRLRWFGAHDGRWMLRSELNWSGEIGPGQGAAESALGCGAERDAVSDCLSRRRPTRTARARRRHDSAVGPLPMLDKGSARAAERIIPAKHTSCVAACNSGGLGRTCWLLNPGARSHVLRRGARGGEHVASSDGCGSVALAYRRLQATT